MTMATGPTIDYIALQQTALRGVVRSVLQQTVLHGLPGEHHFYISFLTQAPGVILSKRLKEKYPHEMTIVLQHRFWELIVSDERFEVKLTFDGIPERLVVPFAAVRVFVDPSVNYGLQFDDVGIDISNDRDARASMTMDAAFDAAGAGLTDAPRTQNTKKARAVRKVKPDKDAAAPRTQRPAMVPPSPEPAAAANPDLAPPAAQAAEDKPAESGAKILSLDQFRKK